MTRPSASRLPGRWRAWQVRACGAPAPSCCWTLPTSPSWCTTPTQSAGPRGREQRLPGVLKYHEAQPWPPCRATSTTTCRRSPSARRATSCTRRWTASSWAPTPRFTTGPGTARAGCPCLRGIGTSTGRRAPWTPPTAFTDQAPPFSCGSAARQSVIKYFLRPVIDKNSQTTIDDAEAAGRQTSWQRPRPRGATPQPQSACADSKTGFACCNPDGSNWLPQALKTPYETVQADQVLQSLSGQLQTFYWRVRRSPACGRTTWTRPSLTRTTGRPTPPARAGRRPAGGATPERPAHYDSTEARSPLVTELWHQCHWPSASSSSRCPCSRRAGTCSRPTCPSSAASRASTPSSGQR